MELFIPSAAVLLLCILIFMYVMPKLSPYILGVASIVLFGLGVWQHYDTFPYEYNKYWSAIKDNSSFILMILLIITLMVSFRSRSSAPMIPESITKNMPQMPAAVAAVPAAVAAIPEILNFSAAKNNARNNGRNNASNNAYGRNNARNNSLASNSFKSV